MGEMKEGATRIRFYPKSGARLYIPQRMLEDPDFPFEDEELVKIEIEDGRLIISRPEWWELIDWNSLPREVFEKLPDEIKEKIRINRGSQ